MGHKNYKVNDFFSIKVFDTEEEKKNYAQGFKDFCESIKSKLEGKGPHSFFQGTKQVSFQNALFDDKRLPEPPKSESSLWQAIESHTNRLMGRNGHSRKLNSFLDLFRNKGQGHYDK